MTVPTSSDDVASTADPILALIERAARDPEVDIDKMERLFGMHEKAVAQRAKAKYLAGLADLQAELPAAVRRGVGHNNKRYARFEDIIEAIKKPMQRHGFSLSFRIDQSLGDRVRITGVLGHSAGHSETTDIVLSADTTGNKTSVQAWGSSVSYGKRYVAVSLLGIATEDDDDGEAGGQGALITEAQAEALVEMLEEHRKNVPAFCRYFKIDAVKYLPARDYERAVAAIQKPRSARELPSRERDGF